MNKSLLIIGKPYSSKTVYITQFYIRLLKKKSKLVLNGAIENLGFLSASKARLVQGELPISTPPEQNDKLTLPVKFEDQIINLECPDYGGEQINKIISERELDESWTEAIKKSDNWVIFIRPTSINKSNDLSNAVISKENIESNGANQSDPPSTNETINTSESYEISDQSAFIELLQILLDAKSNNSLVRNKTIKLTIALTCWDELNTNKSPKIILNENFPLLLDFIESNWDENNFKIIGLSALEFDLSKPENKEKYEIEGPENFGFIVNTKGEQSKDLTELVFEAI